MFVLLLLGGGRRLIGSQDAPQASVPRPALVRAAWVSAPATREETHHVGERAPATQRIGVMHAPENRTPVRRALSDANGNVLASRTYLRTVYQAFALGDGFA